MRSPLRPASNLPPAFAPPVSANPLDRSGVTTPRLPEGGVVELPSAESDAPNFGTEYLHSDGTSTVIMEPQPPSWRESLVYLWDIPGERAGYNLRIEIAADSDEEARYMAIAYRVPVSDTDDRGLSLVEANWVRTVSPLVIRELTAISLDHERALEANAELSGQNIAYRNTRDLFRRHGIDVQDPQSWIDRQMAEVGAFVKSADDERDLRHRRLQVALRETIEKLTRVEDETGFAPAKVVPPAEPDYSKLTVVLPEGVDPREYKRLEGALFTHRDLDTPLTPAEVEALEILNTALWLLWRKGSERDQGLMMLAHTVLNQRLTPLPDTR